jgi:cobalamin biosynthesis protein CobD/CbiB
MNTRRLRLVRRVCWLLLFAICAFHVRSDGANGVLMRELERQGQSPASARAQIHWLCAPLNIATLVVLVVIAGLSVKQKWRRNQTEKHDNAASYEGWRVKY